MFGKKKALGGEPGSSPQAATCRGRRTKSLVGLHTVHFMITVTIQFQELKNGAVDVRGKIVRQCVTQAEAEELRRYDIQDVRDDMCRVADAELRKIRERVERRDGGAQ